ncbi:alpha/beta fold hydrolase [Thermoactinomyces mirandus]|uniref:Alpha/beta fold hydrolase n=1 Tax=Thermoactinomyces mirandus TaxID=2756294 RepID=A0A7W1XQE0_9BACL|nr:alpha/beta hydrolase [Thermoactinomyces mirandus]MBA4601389.1 alpha/beta fold hydrolase [Thermoactinomyces mirandus]
MVEQGKFIEADGILTHYHEAGEGETLLLIHGSGPGVTAWANWKPVFPILSQHFHLYAPDVVGFGDTQRPKGIHYSVDAWVQHMISFIEALKLEKVSIIGNSMGGALALHLAYQRPDLVHKLILMGSVGCRFPITRELDKVWGYTPSYENMKNLIKIFVYDGSTAENEDLVKMRYQASIQEGYQEAFSQMFPVPRQRHVDAMALSDASLRTISAPVLLVHGREDRVIPLNETSWKMAQLLPNAELHVFPRCGHWTQIEKTGAFTDLVVSFLNR